MIWLGKTLKCKAHIILQAHMTSPFQTGFLTKFIYVGQGMYLSWVRTFYSTVCFLHDCSGHAITICTACSSSIVFLGEACTALAKGECTSAIVGGTSIIMATTTTMAISEQGALSPNGSCKTFSSNADGYGRAECILAIYVKPLANALRDGNPVCAVIVGSATNCDGKTSLIWVPSSIAQESLIRRTYKVAGISEIYISKTGFFECHGTGTPIGMVHGISIILPVRLE